jgi:hypothetical protein
MVRVAINDLRRCLRKIDRVLARTILPVPRARGIHYRLADAKHPHDVHQTRTRGLRLSLVVG